MNKKERAKIEKAANALRGRRTVRTIDSGEIDRMAELDRKRDLAGKCIRVYSFDGFVSNGYPGRASIDYIERYYDSNGKKQFHVGQSSANRSYGKGALITVNGRGL